jgi:hypothetical protein
MSTSSQSVPAASARIGVKGALALGCLVAIGCGGTTGQENLPSAATPDAGLADTGVPDAPVTATDDGGDGSFDFADVIQYADIGQLSLDGYAAEGSAPGSDATTPTNLTTEGILKAVAQSCLDCAHTNGCVDDMTNGLTNENCEDQTGTATAGPASGTANQALCLADLSCVLPPANSCARGPSGGHLGAALGPCYCGPADVGVACLSGTAQNGACKTQIENGLETTDPSAISRGLAAPTTPGGVANQIVKCLISNKCDTCFP